jgi:acylphosphatase
MSPDIVRRRAVVSGRVQGVFFRDGARRRAEKAGVAGTARNLRDGTLEVVLEGDVGPVERVLAWLQEGPEGAQVDSVEVEEQAPEGSTGFYIA